MVSFKNIVPVLKVAELQRAIDFYQGVLGFAVVWQAADDVAVTQCFKRNRQAFSNRLARILETSRI